MNKQRAILMGIRGNLHRVHLDARFPAPQGIFDILDDQAGGGIVAGVKQQFMNAAAKFGPHHPLAGRGFVMDKGRIVATLGPDEIGSRDGVRRYLAL